MRVNQIVFFKVPLDNKYENVFNFGYYARFTNQILSIMKLNFPNMIYDVDGKAFKITNDKMTFTFKGDVNHSAKYLKFREYNYCALIENEGLPRFYFITGYSSLYDGVIDSSIELNIEYDYWTNNYANLVKESETQVIRATIPEYEKINNLFYSKGIISQDKQIETLTENEETGQLSNYKVLWMKIYTDGGPFYTYNKTSNTYIDIAGELEWYGVYGSSAQLPVIFCPYAIIDTADFTIVKTFTWGDAPLLASSAPNKTDHVVKAELTYYPPFSYTLNDNKIIINSEFAGIDVLYYKVENKYKPLVHNYSQGRGHYPNFSPVVYYVDEYVDFESMTSTQPTLLNPYKDDKVTISNFSDCIDCAKLYPFNYKLLNVNGNAKPFIIPSYCNNAKIKIYRRNITPYMVIEFYKWNSVTNTFTIVSRSNPVYLYGNGEMPILNDKYDTYIRNSGTTLQTRAVTSITNALVSKNVFSYATKLLGAGTEIATIGASLNDLKNQRDNIYTPSVNANGDYVQDLVFLRSVKYSNESQAFNEAFEEHIKGKYVNGVSFPIFRSHKYFDYIQTNSISLGNITNTNDREALRRIFSNGVRYWHLEDVSADIPNVTKTFNYSVNNTVYPEVT